MTKVYMNNTSITTETATDASSIILAQDDERVCATFLNVGSENVYMNVGAAATTDGVLVYPGCVWEISHDNFTTDAIHAVCDPGATTDVLVMKNVVGLGNYTNHISLGPSDERIGAVEIQDADTTDRAKVRDGNTAGAADDHVLVVQHQGPTGESQPSGADAADPVYTTSAGNVSASLLAAIGAHYSPTHFTATYASATQITLAGLDYILDVSQFLGVIRMDISGNSELITPDDSAYQFAWSDPTLTITGASLVATDKYIVIVAPTVPTATSLTEDAFKVLVQNWPVDTKAHPIHEDTTDESAATYYYPSSSGFELIGYRRGTLQYKLIDAELTVEGKNHDDLDWETITTMSVKHGVGAPAVPPLVIGAAGVTSAGILDFNDLGVDMIRVAVTTYDATNTIQLNWRQRA